MPISVDSLLLQDSVLAAPMAGITDRPYRGILRDFGVEITFSEMIASNSVVGTYQHDREKREGIIAESGRTAIQLAGHDPIAMGEAARHCEDLGAVMLDINFGCPAKRVINRYAGSALMRDEARAARILCAVGDAVNIPVTLKMRTGWDMGRRNAPNIARIAEDCGIRMVSVHARTRQQRFSGRADWRFLRQVKEAIAIPLLANGDIVDFLDARECLRQSGADGLMIGRGILGRPWLIPQLNEYLATGKMPAPVTLEMRFETMHRHFSAITAFYGPRRGVRIARKHLAAYLRDLPSAGPLIKSLMRIEEPKAVLSRLTEIFEIVGGAERSAA